MQRKIQVRFNLGKGPRYKKWKVSYPSGEVKYLEPNDVTIFMYGCKLINYKETAKKIYEGANKMVCAWVEVDDITIDKSSEVDVTVGDEVSYNPKVEPNWVFQNENADKKEFNSLVTKNRGLFII